MATASEALTAGAPPAASTQSQPQGAPSGLPEAAKTGWWDSVKDNDIKGWLANKNYPDAEHALKAHWGLERLLGAEKAGRTVMLPKDENDAEGWKTLTAKLGVPDSPDGYKLPLPEGQSDDAFSKTAAKWFHEAGVPPRSASKIAEAWNGWIAEQVKAGEAAERAESEKQMGALKQEWAHEYDGKRELAQRGYREFAKQFGLDDKAALERAESVLGAANLTKFFAGLGSMNSESAFAGGNGAPGFSGMTKEKAMEELRQIQTKRVKGEINDVAWRTEYLDKVEKLGAIAYRP